MPETTPDREPSQRVRHVRTMARVQSLKSLVGAHPDALHDIYAAGQCADSTKFDGMVRGRILAVERLASVFMLTRPLVQLYSRITPWRGKVFESGGTSGCDRIGRWTPHRFRCEAGDSLVDGKPTLFFHYNDLGNPWPMSTRIDELRAVGESVAIGPVFTSSNAKPVLWWGLAI